MKDIRALIFDFGGTLDGNGVHWLERTYQFIKDRHPEVTREAFDAADKAAVRAFALDHSANAGSYQEGSMLPIGAIASQAAARCTLRETAEAIASGIYQRLGLSNEMKMEYIKWFCAGVTQSLAANRCWLQTLHGTYRLGVISNNFGNTHGWCEEYGLSTLLEVIIDSTVFGVGKPDARIFEAALSALDIAPNQAIYIGDSYAADMVGAKNVGMWTAWLVGDQIKACPNPSMVDVRLSRLQGLTDFLDSA